MKSSSGAYYLALDQIRAIAAWLVICWHFNHFSTGFPVPFTYLPSIALFPAALPDEGHTGVALFMTLSGYLFAKLLDGKSIRYLPFLFNRALRLLPMLLFVVLLVSRKKFVFNQGVGGFVESAWGVVMMYLPGLYLPVLPNGGWSVAVEGQFYLILPFLLWLSSRWRPWPLLFLASSIGLRLALYAKGMSVWFLVYFTMVGRIDQFVLGIAAYQFRSWFVGRHVLAGATFTAFGLFFWNFDRMGGGYSSEVANGLTPVFLPTIEALAYGILIAWYDGSFQPRDSGFSALLARMGGYSYSIYLLHSSVVFRVAAFVHTRIMDISNFYLCTLWATAFYFAMGPIGWLSYRFIEEPFLRFRVRYTVPKPTPPPEPAPEPAPGFQGRPAEA